MSVAAMTMDDQRPLNMNTYEKMSKQYEQNSGIGVGGGGLISSSNSGVGGAGAPPSGPASPTPSGSEEPYHHSHHHHHHHAPAHYNQHHHNPFHHHHHHHQHAAAAAMEHQLQHQRQQSPPSPTPPTHHQQQQAQLASTSVIAVANINETVAAAEQRQLRDELQELKLEQTRLTQQFADAQRREKILMRRLANKEQEFQDYVSQIAEYKAAQAPSALALRSALLDPAVNVLFEKLKKELKATKAKLEETQNELSAWKFTPDSNTGKRLMAKCRLLYQENEELGKMTSNGRLAKLEAELAMQKSFSEEVKKSQSELDDFLQELDEDVEGMQSTILFLQQELKLTRDRIQLLEKENLQLKSDGNAAGLLRHDHVAGADQAGVVVVDNIKTEIDVTAEDDKTQQLSSHAMPNGGSPPDYSTQLPLQTHHQQPLQLIATNSASNDMRFPASALTPTKQELTTTIEENACLRTAPHLTHVDYVFNGTEPGPIAAVIATVAAGDECNSNTGANAMAAGKFRTAASRKRNYESTDSNEAPLTINASVVNQSAGVGGGIPLVITTPTINTSTLSAVAQQQVSAPRTLPPKKSKLRVTPMRSASEQSNEMNESDSMCMGVGVGVGVGVGLNLSMGVNAAAAAEPPLSIIPETAPTIAAVLVRDEETAVIVGGGGTPATTISSSGNSILLADDVVDDGVAQRILTRRRSVRTQQNGGIDNNNGNH